MKHFQADIVCGGMYPEFVRLTEGLSKEFKEANQSLVVQSTILHIPTMRLILIMPRQSVKVKGELLTYKFKQHLPNREMIDMVAVMICRDEELEEEVSESDVPIIIEQIIKRAVEYSSRDLYSYIMEGDNDE